MFITRTMRLHRVLLKSYRLLFGSFGRQLSSCHPVDIFQKLFIPWMQYRRKALGPLFSTYILYHLSLVKMSEDIVKEADNLYESQKYEEIYKLLLKHKDEKNPEILWRLGRACYKWKEHLGDDEKAKAIEEALVYLTEALSLNDKLGPSHKWYAILLGSKKRHPTFKDQILEAFQIREHLEKAIELTPTDPTIYYVLGNWCFEIASVSWYQRKAAQVLFATPPQASFEDALSNFEKAEEIDPNFFSRNLLMMAKTHLQLNRKEDAIKCLKKARDYEPKKTHDDQLVAKEAEQLLQKYGAS